VLKFDFFFAALYGFTSPVKTKNLKNFIIYISCPFGIVFDRATEAPKRVSKQYLLGQLKIVGRDFLICTVLMSILAPYNYALFHTNYDAHSMQHTFQDLFSWQHLMNNYLVARELPSVLAGCRHFVHKSDLILLNFCSRTACFLCRLK